MTEKRAGIFSNLFPPVEDKLVWGASIRHGGGITSCLLLNTWIESSVWDEQIKIYDSGNLHWKVFYNLFENIFSLRMFIFNIFWSSGEIVLENFENVRYTLTSTARNKRTYRGIY